MRFEQMEKLSVFEIPTVMKHGIGIIEQLGNEVKDLGIDKPLIVTDKGIIKLNLIEPVKESLNKKNISYIIYSELEGEPTTKTVAKGTAIYKEKNCDGLIAIGGGSAMDTAKGIGVEVVHGEPVLEYECIAGKKPLAQRIPPLITIPTTAGTGSEVTLWSVIKDTGRKIKFNTGGPLIAPYLAFVDPELHVSMPPHITAATGMDALCHAIECYTCHYAQPQTSAVALLAIEYVGKYLRRAVANGQDIEARYGMAMAALLAGLSYGSESAGAVHAMTQPLGGMVPVSHGEAVAATLVPVMEYNWIGDPEKFARIAQALGVNTFNMNENEAARASIKAVRQLKEDIDIPTLSELGIKKEMIPQLAKAAFNDPQTIGNPRDIDIDGYIQIYEKCFEENQE